MRPRILVCSLQVGEALARGEATPESVGAAVVRLIDPAHMPRARARALAASCRAAGGARGAADLVLDLAKGVRS